MDLIIEWKEIVMVLASAVGGILSILLFLITTDDLAFMLFPLFLIGGWILGLLIESIKFNK